MSFPTTKFELVDPAPTESTVYLSDLTCANQINMSTTFDNIDLSTVNLDLLNEQIGGNHYQKSIQPWDAMKMWMSPEQFKGFLRGNAIKYLARCDEKGGIEDLKKARHYLDKLIEFDRTRVS